MGQNTVFLFLILAVPVLGSFLLPLIGKISRRLRNYSALFCVFIPFVLSLALLPVVCSGQKVSYTIILPLGFNFSVFADGLAVFMALVSSFISSIIVIYSFDYISRYENQNEYYSMVVLFLGSMMGIVYSSNLIFLYTFWELTAITGWRLIGFYREKDYVFRADKSFIITAFGALVMLIGFIMLHSEAGSFDLAILKDFFLGKTVNNIAVLLILAGIFSKSATLPFHTWLPDAGVAPSPVTALLHAAVLVKIGVYIFARLFVVTLPLADFWHTAVLAAAAVSCIVSAGCALLDTNLKRIIAFSTISQIGFIFMGLSVRNAVGIAGGILYILMHGLGKAGLFLCAGIVEQNAKTKDITQMGGLYRTMPVTAVSFLLCSFSIMAIPPFGGFFAKYMVFYGAVKDGSIFLAVVFMFCAFLTIMYLFRAFSMVFFGESKGIMAREGSRLMTVCVALLALLSLLAGIFVKYPLELIQEIVRNI